MAASTKTCCSDSSSSDSSSSEDEDVAKLREAVVACPVTASSTSIPPKKGTAIQKKNKQQNLIRPSLRPSEKSHDNNNALQTTPEFRAHVAKKLSKILDSSVTVIKKTGAKVVPVPVSTDEKNDSDFKLFTTSVPGNEVKEPTTKRRRLPSSSSDSSDEDRFMSCAVSGDAILAQSRVPSISTDTSQSGSTIKDPCSKLAQTDNSDESCEKLKRKKSKKKKKEQKDQEQCDDNDNASESDHKTMKQHKKHKKKKSKD